MSVADPVLATCPTPRAKAELVLLGHGSGGQLSATLLHDVIVPALGDAAAPGCLRACDGELVVSTDSFVVAPRFFPGGDIGRLAVHGTVNDVAMRGGEPFALSLAFIVEEGLSLAELRRIAASAGKAATEAGVPVVAGDPKVVGRGAADGLFITTSGLGRRLPGARLSAAAARPGDAVLLSGPIGQHGVAVLGARHRLEFGDAREPNQDRCVGEVVSDTRALHRLTRTIIEAGGEAVHALRDPTRGGLASALHEIAQASGVGVVLDEPALPVPEPVARACEMLGLDPLHVANQGCLVAFVAPETADRVLTAMRARPEGADAVHIGVVTGEHPRRVTARTLVGARRSVEMPAGEQPPRIC